MTCQEIKIGLEIRTLLTETDTAETKVSPIAVMTEEITTKAVTTTVGISLLKTTLITLRAMILPTRARVAAEEGATAEIKVVRDLIPNIRASKTGINATEANLLKIDSRATTTTKTAVIRINLMAGTAVVKVAIRTTVAEIIRVERDPESKI
jgi:hypothetical protein